VLRDGTGITARARGLPKTLPPDDPLRETASMM
jgi:hypothetical protein